MHKTARNLSALGLGLSISALVGWLLLRENKRVRELSAITVKSRSRDMELDDVPAIPLPMEAIDDSDDAVLAEDDLTQIDGIGRTFADALHAIGIRRFEQLAQQKPDDLADRLAAHTSVTSQRIRNKDWIGQAKRLAKA